MHTDRDRSEVREQQLLQAMHGINAPDVIKPDDQHHGSLEKEEAHKSEAGGGGGEKRGVLQAMGELVSQSTYSVKEAVLGKEGDQANQDANHSSPNQTADSSQDESAQVSLVVHSIAHD